MKFHFYQDPEHGWLKVPRRLLSDMNLLKKISSCSYQRKAFVYLEEDCDMTLFETTYKDSRDPTKGKPDHVFRAKSELDYIVHCTNNQSRIRSYASFAPHIND